MLRSRTAFRGFSGGIRLQSSWTQQWTAAVGDFRSDLSHDESADQLRALIRTNLLEFEDITKRPERFFEAHRVLATHAPSHGPGFWIRFTVQFNLFAGTIAGLAGPEQQNVLKNLQREGKTGCFALTEILAGVNSGLVVNTVAEWDDVDEVFRLSTPDEGARKNWISQGFTADNAVVVADLIFKGESKGPHAFLITLREGELLEGITIGDMGRKTVGNDLDNVWIDFDRVKVPKSALLNRFADIKDGEYVKLRDVSQMQMIGQRLFTGRVAVAQAALEFTRGLFSRTRTYADNKSCWAPRGSPVLSNIPQLKSLFNEYDEEMHNLDRFVGWCEQALCDVLKDEALPSVELMHAIAVSKVKAVEHAIDLSFRLKQEVGSYALMADTGFEQMDFLQSCKFAEGDSRILMQKMARDEMRAFSKGKAPRSVAVHERCEALAQALQQHTDQQEGWDAHWEQVYGLAGEIMDHTMKDVLAKC